MAKGDGEGEAEGARVLPPAEGERRQGAPAGHGQPGQGRPQGEGDRRTGMPERRRRHRRRGRGDPMRPAGHFKEREGAPFRQAPAPAAGAPPAAPRAAGAPGPRGSPASEKQRNVPGLVVMLLALAGLLVAAVMIFLPFVTPIALALVIATIAHPFFSLILRWVGGKRRGLASALTCLALVVLVFAPLSWVGWTLAREANAGIDVAEKGLVKLYDWAQGQPWFQELKEKEWFKSYWRSVEAILSPRAPPEGTAILSPRAPPEGTATLSAGEPGNAGPEPGAGPGAKPAAPDGQGAPGESPVKAFPLGVSLAQWFTHTAATLVANTFEFALKSLLMLFILFYFFKDGSQLLRSLQKAIPVDPRYQERVADTFRRVSQSIIRGSFLTALAQGAVAAVAFAIVGLPAIFWGVMTAFAALIPPVGTTLVTLPLTLFLFLGGDWGRGIFLAIVAVVIGSLDNVLRPILVGGSLRMHPIWLLLSILGALQLFGPLGLIFGPMVLVLLGTFLALLVREEGAGTVGSMGPRPSRSET